MCSSECGDVGYLLAALDVLFNHLQSNPVHFNPKRQVEIYRIHPLFLNIIRFITHYLNSTASYQCPNGQQRCIQPLHTILVASARNMFHIPRLGLIEASIEQYMNKNGLWFPIWWSVSARAWRRCSRASIVNRRFSLSKILILNVGSFVWRNKCKTTIVDEFLPSTSR